LFDQEVELLTPQRVSLAGHHGTAQTVWAASLCSESVIHELALKNQLWMEREASNKLPETLLVGAGDDSERIGAAVQAGADQVLGREQLQLKSTDRRCIYELNA